MINARSRIIEINIYIKHSIIILFLLFYGIILSSKLLGIIMNPAMCILLVFMVMTFSLKVKTPAFDSQEAKTMLSFIVTALVSPFLLLFILIIISIFCWIF